MSLGYTEGFRAFEARTEFGTNEGYNSIWQSQGSSGQNIWFLQAFNSSFAEVGNRFPAFVSGTVKKLIERIIINGGGRADNFIQINGLDVGANILATPSGQLGTFEVDNINVPFVADDFISFRWTRSASNGTLQLIAFSEIDWSDANNIQHWISSFERKGSTSAGFICPKNGGQVNVGGNLEQDFQVRAPFDGTILDFIYYGTSPVSADAIPNFDVRINGATDHTEVLSQHGGAAIDRFDGVDVPFVEGDLLGLRYKSPSNSVLAEGRAGWRIEFD